jgi:hypothetical protein
MKAEYLRREWHRRRSERGILMPFMLPTTPFFSSTTSLNGIVYSSSAFTSGGLGRIAASIAADPPSGGAATTTALGGTIGTAPPGSVFLDVTAATASLENGLAIATPMFPPASAQAYADLSILVQEFSPTGAFVKNVWGPATVVYDVSVFFFGVNIRADERRTRTASIHTPVVGGFIYRVWLASFQFVNANFAAHAASNFTYDFGPLFFVFT